MLKVLSTIPLVLLITILTASCAGSDGTTVTVPGDAQRTVPLGEWCGAAGKQMCGQLGDRCGDGSSFAQGVAEGCEESFAPSCVGSRDRSAPSGGTAAQLQECLQKIDQAACPELMSVLALPPCHLDLPPG